MICLIYIILYIRKSTYEFRVLFTRFRLHFISTDFILKSKGFNSKMQLSPVFWHMCMKNSMHVISVRPNGKTRCEKNWRLDLNPMNLLSKHRTYKSVTNGFLFCWLVWYFLPNFFSHKWDLQGSLSLSEFQKKSN